MNQNKCTNQHYQLFQSQLQCILAHVSKEMLTFEELYLIYYESNIKFHNQSEHHKLKEYFNQNNNLLPLRDCISMTELHTCQIVHNRPLFLVTTASPNHHQDKVCFADWKQLMTNKFGSQMRWFDMIAGQMQSRKIKSFDFKNRLKLILKGTPHESCAESICRKFPKNKKNEIEWGTFMAVVRYIDGRYNSTSKPSPILVELSQSPRIQKIKTEIEGSKSTKSASKRLSNLYSRQCQRVKESRSNKNSKIHSSYHQYDSVSNVHEDDFQMKSSLQIDREYKAITRKFNLYDNQENIRIARNRAKSAKNTPNSCKANNSLSINWGQSRETLQSKINMIQSSYGIYVNRQKISTTQYLDNPPIKTRKLKNNYFTSYPKSNAKQHTEPIYLHDQF